MDGIDIRIARIRAGLKQYEVAQRAGLRPDQLSLIENNRAALTPETLARIGEALRLDKLARGPAVEERHGRAD
jgi:transcriptional regulator with XRE-family HTH domain